ncbi:hypothetical protein GCM10009864_39850 [Streptomyces lunalinharesii]|uniref:Uncharacterized protein n=1 Tax=Streptomyces lunalinharesii TaxID=333384 RepID=A0ABP6EEL2_9ACTN
MIATEFTAEWAELGLDHTIQRAAASANALPRTSQPRWTSANGTIHGGSTAPEPGRGAPSSALPRRAAPARRPQAHGAIGSGGFRTAAPAPRTTSRDARAASDTPFPERPALAFVGGGTGTTAWGFRPVHDRSRLAAFLRKDTVVA